MSALERIDTTFDFREDAQPGTDPDATSPTLKRYHQLLWSKRLWSGADFSLSSSEPGSYLHHRSALGEFWLTSDSIVPSYRSWSRFGLPEIVHGISDIELGAFQRLTYTIGGMMLFPSWTGERHWSINQARGMLPKIADRMDLTLECIRRHYSGELHPMMSTLAWYEKFFGLFGDFDAYVSFFLLDDLLTPDRTQVRFFLPFDDFTSNPATPADRQQYRAYMDASSRFVTGRNERIRAWADATVGFGSI